MRIKALDGHDIQALNLHWLRRQISLVGQDPILFNTTIYENICYGLGEPSSIFEEDGVRERIVSAARMANAHDFIVSLPNGYQTLVGERGLHLSGGQRQRIAIARALVKDPIILLLDEATSALDSKSEFAVQNALDSAAQGRTTILIAHRLSTVRGADNIIVMSEGQIVEQGQHDYLIAQGGLYASLVQNQNFQESHDRVDDAGDSSEAPLEDSLAEESRPSAQPHHLEKSFTEKPQASGIDVAPNTVPKPHRSSLFNTLRFIEGVNRPERRWLIFGFVCAFIAGLGIPMYAHPSSIRK